MHILQAFRTPSCTTDVRAWLNILRIYTVRALHHHDNRRTAPDWPRPNALQFVLFVAVPTTTLRASSLFFIN